MSRDRGRPFDEPLHSPAGPRGRPDPHDPRDPRWETVGTGGGGDDDDNEGRMRPLSPWLLVALGLLGASIGWGLVAVMDAMGRVAPSVSWVTTAVWALLAAILVTAAWTTRQRIQVRRDYIEPQRAVFLLTLARASSLVGSLCCGGYVGFGLRFVGHLDVAGPRHRVLVSGSSALLALVVVIAAVVLERACRVPKDSESQRA